MNVEQRKPMYRNVATSAWRVRIAGMGLSLCLLASQSAVAVNYPLQEEQVREGYFLGRTTDGEKLTDFYKQYVHYLPFPARGPYFSHVESVEFRTPYELVVLRSREKLNQYSALEADEDYRAHPNLIAIRVMISFKSGYAGPIPLANSFKVRVSQADPIEPKKLTTQSICSVWQDCGVTRFAVLLWFDAEQFASGAARVKITTPDGQILKTEFDLDKLT
jgi:hypothetical protein